MQTVKQTNRHGFSLIELVLVVIVLAILAGIVVPMIGGLNQISTPGGSKSDRQIVTETTMRSIRDAIMGTETRPGVWPDLGQRPATFPQSPAYPDLLLADLAVAQQVEPSLTAFNPVTKLGWRGPYLTGVTQLVDAWGNSFDIQVGDVNGNSQLDDFDIRYARLVSPGEDGILDTDASDGFIPGDDDPADDEINLEECGDDIVLFFRVADTRQ